MILGKSERSCACDAPREPYSNRKNPEKFRGFIVRLRSGATHLTGQEGRAYCDTAQEAHGSKACEEGRGQGEATLL